MCLHWFLLAFVQIGDVTSDSQVRSDLARNKQAYRELRIVAEFRMKVIRRDDALGGSYFPNCFPVGKSTATGLAGEEPRPRWVEDYFRVGDRFRWEIDFSDPDAKGDDTNPRLVYLFDGQHSWNYNPLQRRASSTLGKSLNVGPNMDYFGDMVGYPKLFKRGTRTVGGDTEDAYDLADLNLDQYQQIPLWQGERADGPGGRAGLQSRPGVPGSPVVARPHLPGDHRRCLSGCRGARHVRSQEERLT